MKNIIKFMAGALLAGLTMTACSPDEFDGANQSGLPTMDGVDFTYTVDQETNTVTATAPTIDGEYPVWYIGGAKYSTSPTVTWSNVQRGTYDIELKMANRNGFSQSSVKKQFTFNETKVDFAPYLSNLADKSWRIDNSVESHLACGAPNTDGTNWWKATPDAKKDNSIYDDRITFTPNTGDDVTGGSYTYSSGEDGKTFVNTGTTLWGSQGADWDATIAAGQTANFNLEAGTWTDSEGNVQDCLYLTLDDNTLFPYISCDAQYQKPRFRIEGLTASTLSLVYDNGAISWHFIFTSKDPDANEFGGYKYDSDANLWKGMTYTNEFYYVHGGSWEANPDPIGFAASNGNQNFNISLPDESNDQWQAQVKFYTTMSTTADKTYDFSAKFKPTKDIKGATVKLVLHGNDNTYYFADRIDLAAGDTYVFYKDNMPGIDMDNVDLVLDFGGAPAGSEVQVSDIVLKDHAADDGAGHPQAKAKTAKRK